MNIFVLHSDPEICARFHCDKHVGKMLLESCQIMSTAVQLELGKEIEGLYKKTHISHPCVKWCRESKHNFHWLWRLASNLSNEFAYRFYKTHKSSELLIPLLQYIGIFSSKKLKFIQCMPETYKQASTIKAYRDYYYYEKYKLLIYTRRSEPKFIERRRNADGIKML